MLRSTEAVHEAPRKFIRALPYPWFHLCSLMRTDSARGDSDESHKSLMKTLQSLADMRFGCDKARLENGKTMGGNMSWALLCRLQGWNLDASPKNMYEALRPRPPLKLPVMAIRLFAALFWIPSRRMQGPPSQGDPQVPAQKSDTHSDRFFPSVSFNFPKQERKQWWLAFEA